MTTGPPAGQKQGTMRLRQLGRRRPKIPPEACSCTGVFLVYALSVAGHRRKRSPLCIKGESKPLV